MNMNMKKVFCGILCGLLWGGSNVNAQKVLSQEQAELQQLKKYEQNNPPKINMPLLVAEENEDLFGARLMRSSTLLATSSPERKQPVFVLFMMFIVLVLI